MRRSEGLLDQLQLVVADRPDSTGAQDGENATKSGPIACCCLDEVAGLLDERVLAHFSAELSEAAQLLAGAEHAANYSGGVQGSARHTGTGGRKPTTPRPAALALTQSLAERSGTLRKLTLTRVVSYGDDGAEPQSTALVQGGGASAFGIGRPAAEESVSVGGGARTELLEQLCAAEPELAASLNFVVSTVTKHAVGAALVAAEERAAETAAPLMPMIESDGLPHDCREMERLAAPVREEVRRQAAASVSVAVRDAVRAKVEPALTALAPPHTAPQMLQQLTRAAVSQAGNDLADEAEAAADRAAVALDAALKRADAKRRKIGREARDAHRVAQVTLTPRAASGRGTSERTAPELRLRVAIAGLRMVADFEVPLPSERQRLAEAQQKQQAEGGSSALQRTVSGGRTPVVRQAKPLVLRQVFARVELRRLVEALTEAREALNAERGCSDRGTAEADERLEACMSLGKLVVQVLSHRLSYAPFDLTQSFGGGGVEKERVAWLHKALQAGLAVLREVDATCGGDGGLWAAMVISEAAAAGRNAWTLSRLLQRCRRAASGASSNAARAHWAANHSYLARLLVGVGHGGVGRLSSPLAVCEGWVQQLTAENADDPEPEPEPEPGSRLAAQQEEEGGDSGVSPPLAELGRAIIDQALAAAATGATDGVESLPAGYARMAATLGYAGSQNGPLLVQLSV